jgi:hypothetical protein
MEDILAVMEIKFVVALLLLLETKEYVAVESLKLASLRKIVIKNE